MRRGQVAIEFIAVFALVFIIFIFMQFNIFTWTDNLGDNAASINANNLVTEVTSLTESTSIYSNFNSKFELPSFLAGGFNYNLGFANSSIYLTWNGTHGRVRTIARQTSVFNVTNSTGSAFFTIAKGTRSISRTSTGVVIS
ncbi:MAG: hypothetical protein V1722_05650 [Candidatus Micrarchaeota archaeon]